MQPDCGRRTSPRQHRFSAATYCLKTVPENIDSPRAIKGKGGGERGEFHFLIAYAENGQPEYSQEVLRDWRDSIQSVQNR
jgi:hypothetical protein